jgi:hypothetical protein
MAMTGRFGDHTSLDSYLTTLDSFSIEDEDGELEAEEGVEEETMGPEAVERAERAEESEGEAGRCGLCGEGSSFERLRLHAGALCLYLKGDRCVARADIDHVYHKCRKGLIDNIRFLRRLFIYVFQDASQMGRPFRLLGVGKAYGDSLYVYGVGSFPEEFEGLKLIHIKAERVESLEALHYGLEPVPEEVVGEALEVDG